MWSEARGPTRAAVTSPAHTHRHPTASRPGIPVLAVAGPLPTLLLLMNYYDSCSKETMASFVFQMSLVYTVAFVSVQHEISSSGRLALNHRASSS